MTIKLKRYISHSAYGGYQYENTEIWVEGEDYKEVKKELDGIVKEIKSSIHKEREEQPPFFDTPVYKKK